MLTLKELDEYIFLKDYKSLSKNCFNVDVNELKENNEYISWLLKANLECKDYDLSSFFIENLIRNGIESYEIYVYLFTSLLKINDLYRIKSYMMRSTLIKTDIEKGIFDGDYTITSTLKDIDDDNLFTLVVLIMFLDDLFNNYNENLLNVTKDEEMILFYETIDLVITNGVDIEKMEMMNYIGSLLFN